MGRSSDWDVHKETIAVSVACAGRSAPVSRGEIVNRPDAVRRLLKRLNEEFGGQLLLFCCEAGPCGYVLHEQLTRAGHECQVVAPSLIPKQAGRRIKTDRRDADKLARRLRSGDLMPVWVPDAETMAMRDLVRARGDMKIRQRQARQQLNAFVLRHGHAWPANKVRWTQAHFRWFETLRFRHEGGYVALQEYIDAVRECTERVASVTREMERRLPRWSLAPAVHSLSALRGID